MSRDRQQGKLQPESWFSLLGAAPVRQSVRVLAAGCRRVPNSGLPGREAKSGHGQVQVQVLVQHSLRLRMYVDYSLQSCRCLCHTGLCWASGWGCDVTGQDDPVPQLRQSHGRQRKWIGMAWRPGLSACMHEIVHSRRSGREGGQVDAYIPGDTRVDGQIPSAPVLCCVMS